MSLLQTESGVPIHLHTARAAYYAMFELQLALSEAVIPMEDGGSAWRDAPRRSRRYLRRLPRA